MRLGAAIAAELEPKTLVQMITDACVDLSGAACGAFFGIDAEHACQLWALSGEDMESLATLGLPRHTPLLGSVFRGDGIVHLDDVSKDPRFGRNHPNKGMPPGHPPVRSFMALPVISRTGKVLGVLLFGHPEPGQFDERSQSLITAIAAQAAVALDNARLYESLKAELTRRAEIEQALRESESLAQRRLSLVQTIYSSAPAGLCFVDQDTRFVEINERLAALDGRPVSAYIGYRLGEVSPVLDRIAGDFIRRALDTGEPILDVEVHGTLHPARSEGHAEHTWLASFLPVRDGQGVICGVNTVLLDISVHKRYEQALADAARHKDEFLALLGHELRNPLGVIRNAVEVQKLIDVADPSLIKTRATIDRQATHMTRLIDDLLDVSRIARGKVRLKLEQIELGELVATVIGDHRAEALAKQITLEPDIAAEAVVVHGDRTRLSQVIGNLLDNALKFTDSAGTIRVQMYCQGGEARVAVRDSGIGIEPTLLGQLFETFRQADQSLDRSGGGLGLGLAVVKGLVELHGGRIEAHSAGPGTGATFVVCLPRTASPKIRDTRSTPGLAAPARSTAHGLRVLIIDDNLDSAESMGDALRFRGYSVQIAYDGTSGLAQARRSVPDVVLCDIGLPGDLSGYGVAQAMRKDPSLRTIELIAVTGYGTADDRRKAHEAGFDLHLTKPVDTTHLLAVLTARGTKQGTVTR